MSSPYLSEIRLVSFNFPPKGWAFCNGQILQINNNQALFSLLGTNYGGDGRTTFALPDLRGRVPMHFGSGLPLGQMGGESAHTLNLQEANHVHTLKGSGLQASSTNPAGNVLAVKRRGGKDMYFPPPGSPLSSSSISSYTAGGNQAHTNLQPHLVLNFVIALVGIFPSQN